MTTSTSRTAQGAGIRVAVALVSALLAGGSSTGCTTTRRAANLVIEHHVGMARSAVELVTGEAEAREGRIAKLRADLEESRQALEAERDANRQVSLLERHVALQDAMIAELEAAPGHTHGGGGHGPTGDAAEEPRHTH